MITARPVLIRADHGVIRVLRLHVDVGGIWQLAYEVHPDEDMCRVCGCTNLFGCTPPCGWVNAAHTLCSRCYEKELR